MTKLRITIGSIYYGYEYDDSCFDEDDEFEDDEDDDSFYYD